MSWVDDAQRFSRSWGLEGVCRTMEANHRAQFPNGDPFTAFKGVETHVQLNYSYTNPDSIWGKATAGEFASVSLITSKAADGKVITEETAGSVSPDGSFHVGRTMWNTSVDKAVLQFTRSNGDTLLMDLNPVFPSSGPGSGGTPLLSEQLINVTVQKKPEPNADATYDRGWMNPLEGLGVDSSYAYEHSRPWIDPQETARQYHEERLRRMGIKR